MTKIWMIFICISLIAGCRNNQYKFKMVVTYSDDPSFYQKFAGLDRVKAKFSYVKVTEKTKSKYGFEIVIKLENKGNKTVCIPVRKYILLDDEGHRFRAKLPLEYQSLSNITIVPKDSLKLTLFFKFPDKYVPAYVGSVRLLWCYSINGRIYRRVTKFIRHTIEYRYKKVYPIWWTYPCSSYWDWNYRFHLRIR